MRIFLALPLPDPVTDRLGRVTSRLSFGRPVPPENMHVTLAFFPEVSAAEMRDIHEVVEGLRAWTFEARIAGLDLMGGAKPALLVAQVAPSLALSALHQELHAGLRAVGLVEARRKFRPHVTVLRLGNRLNAPQQAQVQGVLHDHATSVQERFDADRVVIYRSHLGTSPPVHEPLAEVPLGPYGAAAVPQ